jgi:outer membrane protein assembly factor BamD
MPFEAGDDVKIGVAEMRNAILALSLSLLTLSGAGCNSYNVRSDITAEERWSLAKSMFENKDYLQARTQLKILTLNSPGLPFIDEAQFLLAESHFNLKEYILAADEYQRLVRFYPRSQWVDDAQFKVALSSYELSPRPTLDAKYTIQATQQLQRFIEDYPSSDLIPEAERLLQHCRAKLAEKEFKSAVLYRKMRAYASALVYFDSVLENYYDTEYVMPALYWKAVCLSKLKRPQEAFNVFEQYVNRYPETRNAVRAREQLEALQAEMSVTQETNGASH